MCVFLTFFSASMSQIMHMTYHDNQYNLMMILVYFVRGHFVEAMERRDIAQLNHQCFQNVVKVASPKQRQACKSTSQRRASFNISRGWCTLKLASRYTPGTFKPCPMYYRTGQSEVEKKWNSNIIISKIYICSHYYICSYFIVSIYFGGSHGNDQISI